MKKFFDYPKHAFKEYEGRLAINILGNIKEEKGNLYLLLKFIKTEASLMSNPAFAIFKCKIYNIHHKRIYTDRVRFIIDNRSQYQSHSYKWLTNKSAKQLIIDCFEV